MKSRTGPTAVGLRLNLYPTEEGGRRNPLAIETSYRPHLMGTSGEYLGTAMQVADPLQPGESGSAVALLPFDVDYSCLVVGEECEVLEGHNRVGYAVVTRSWTHALEFRHESHSLGVAPLALDDPGMGLWSGPFLPRDGYGRVRPIFRRFGDASDGQGSAAEEARRLYYEERDSLGLRAYAWPSGDSAEVNWIHIWDFGELADLMADVQGWQPIGMQDDSGGTASA